MAIDFGDVRTGLSVSDASGSIPGRSITVTAKGLEALIEKISDFFNEEKPERVIMGLPVNMNGTYGPRAEKTKAFGERLGVALGQEILYWDERGSSVSANRILSDSGKKRGKQREKVDAVAAAVILQSYLDFLRLKG